MESTVRMMLMDVVQFLAMKTNSAMITLHHWLEQYVLVLMVLLQTVITQDVLVSAVSVMIVCKLACFSPDIDECEDDLVCMQMCTNTFGSYQCSCNDGYQATNDTNQCMGTYLTDTIQR